MKFSFLMCINKKNSFMYKAIDSMFKQDFDEPYEVIIIANNCDDELWLELNCLLKGKDNSILERTNIGQLAFNLNYGINLSKSDYIVRMDSDDVCMPSRLSILDSFISDNNNFDVIGTNAELINESDNIIGVITPPKSKNDIEKKIHFGNPFIHPTTCIKRTTLLSNGGYLGGFQSEDYDLWLRLIRKKQYNFINIDIITLQYRINDQQSRGRKLPYAEVTGHLVKEFSLNPSFILFIAVLTSFFKSFLLPKK